MAGAADTAGAAGLAGTAPVEALLFDMGNVVITIDFDRCFAHWAQSSGRAVEDLSSRFAMDAAYEDHEVGVLDTASYWTSVRDSLSIDLSDDQLAAGWNDIFVGPIDEVFDLLAQVPGDVPLHAFTNSNPCHQGEWSQRFAAELAVFDSVFVSSELGHRKPGREAFELVADTIGVPPSRILFFDDSEQNVVGARQTGLQAVHVTSPDSVRHALESAGLLSGEQVR